MVAARLFERARKLQIDQHRGELGRGETRLRELRAKGDEVSYEEILQNVLSRDKADMTRAISPLRKADDAVVLDNSCMTVAEQMEWFEKEFRRAIGDGR